MGRSEPESTVAMGPEPQEAGDNGLSDATARVPPSGTSVPPVPRQHGALQPIAHRGAPPDVQDREPPKHLGRGAATFVAFVLIGAVNAAAIEATLSKPGAGWSVRALHHLYDAGHLVAL